MKYIPNQPVILSQAENFLIQSVCFSDEINYNQIVDNAEQTQFQMSIAPCDDAEQFLPNPNFATATGWDLQANWAFGTGTLCATNATAIAECEDSIPEGYWKFTIVVSTITEGALHIVLDGVTLLTITSAGTYYAYGTSPVGGSILEMTIDSDTTMCITEFSALPMSSDFVVTIFDKEGTDIGNINPTDDPEYFVLVRDTITTTINWAALDANNGCFYLGISDPCGGTQFISNMFKIGAFADKCTVLINSCNNNDSFGFTFVDSGFSPRLRIAAKLRQAKYSDDRSLFENSAGTKGAFYFSGRKSKTLAIDLQPEYVHDYLRTLGGYDNFYIDNVAYFVEDDDYQNVYPSELDIYSSVNITVSEKTQNVKNTLYSDTEVSCNLAE